MPNEEKQDFRLLTEVGMMGVCGYSVESTEIKVDEEELYGKKKESANETKKK